MLALPDTLQSQAQTAATKLALLRTPGRFLVSGMFAGAYIGIGVVLMVCTAGPLVAAGDGFAKLVSGLVFGVALTIVVFAGGELVTSAMMSYTQGVLMRSIPALRALGGMLAMFAANLLGALAFAGLIVASGVLEANAPAGHMLSDMLAAKAAEGPVELFTRGILCNLLVCLAIWMAARVENEVAKILLIFAAITAFISSGFEHVVANMTTFGIGLFTGDPSATFTAFGNNLLWVGLGNLVGGGLVVGAGYWLIGGRPGVARESVGVQSSSEA